MKGDCSLKYGEIYQMHSLADNIQKRDKNNVKNDKDRLGLDFSSVGDVLKEAILVALWAPPSTTVA